MKKVFVILLMLMAFCSSAFATCNLDLNRWKLTVPTIRALTYFDTHTLKKTGPTSFSAWICHFYTGIESDCGNNICTEKGYNKKEHYHYLFVEYDYNAYTVRLKGTVKKDEQGNTYHLYKYSNPAEEEVKSIPPGSVGEEMMLKIKEYFEKEKDYKYSYPAET